MSVNVNKARRLCVRVSVGVCVCVLAIEGDFPFRTISVITGAVQFSEQMHYVDRACCPMARCQKGWSNDRCVFMVSDFPFFRRIETQS